MTKEEFEAKLSKIPVQDPDEIDLAMLADGEKINDRSVISLEELEQELRYFE